MKIPLTEHQILVEYELDSALSISIIVFASRMKAIHWGGNFLSGGFGLFISIVGSVKPCFRWALMFSCFIIGCLATFLIHESNVSILWFLIVDLASMLIAARQRISIQIHFVSYHHYSSYLCYDSQPALLLFSINY